MSMLLASICFIWIFGIASIFALSSPSPSTAAHQLFINSRPDILNLLNHPLQLQLATGEVPLGSFRRLVADRRLILGPRSHSRIQQHVKSVELVVKYSYRSFTAAALSPADVQLHGSK